MKAFNPILAAFLLASGLALGVPATASADEGQRVSSAGDRHGGAMQRGERRDRMMHMLRDLDLSEAQRDQIFQIRHAQAPAMREQAKALRAARKDLRELAMAPDYDAAKAQASADSMAKAMATMALMRVESTRKVLAVLTPEQRQKLDERREQWKARRGARS